MRGKSALVTGGAGFIGSHLVEELLRQGADRVRVIDDLSLGSRRNLAEVEGDPRVELTVGDASDLSLLESLCTAGEPFDQCYNLAVIPLPHSLELPRENVERNVAMTTAVCELGRAGRFHRLIHCSSSEVYGTARTVPMNEEHPLHPQTPYAAAKSASDLTAVSYAVTFGVDVVVVRPFNTYGERQNDGAYAGLIPAVINAVRMGLPVTIHGDGDQTRDMSYVRDTARGIVLVATSAPSRRMFNLGSGSEASVNEMVRLLLDALGQSGHPIVHGAPRPGDVRRLLADVGRARKELGFQSEVSLRDGLKRTAAWYVDSARAAHQ